MTKNTFMSEAEKKELRQRRFYAVLPFLSMTLLILLWIFVAHNNPNRFPSPVETYNRLVMLMNRPIKGLNMLGHIWASLARVFIALVISWTIGISFGILTGWNKACYALFNPIFSAFRSVPPLAWIPLITIWFGTGEGSKILVIITGSLASIVVNTQAGMNNISKIYLDVGTVFNANANQKLFEIAIPSALDAIFAGIRTSTSAAWMVVVAAEMLGGDSGVGFLIIRGMDSLDMPLVLLSMICIGLVGAMLAVLTQYTERMLCPWTRKRSN